MGLLKARQFPLEDEKVLQEQIFQMLEPLCANMKIGLEREKKLNKNNVIDFLLTKDRLIVGLKPVIHADTFPFRIGIEVKLCATQRRAIYRQCVSYCSFPAIDEFILITNSSMGFPLEINGKSCYVVNLGKAWL